MDFMIVDWIYNNTQWVYTAVQKETNNCNAAATPVVYSNIYWIVG